jgi:hypothetical protein
MAEGFARVVPRFAIISYVMRGDESAGRSLEFEKEDHEIFEYVGNRAESFRFQLAKNLQCTLPRSWQSIVVSCHKIQPRAFSDYYTNRYLIRFSGSEVDQSNSLLFGTQKNKAIPELQQSVASVDTNNNIRRNRFTHESPADFAFAVLVEVQEISPPLQPEEPAPGIIKTEKLTEIAKFLRTKLEQEEGLSLPSSFADVVFTAGSLVGTAWETSVLGRWPAILTPAQQTLIPTAMVDWLDLADAIEIARDLSRRLRELRIVETPLTEYIDAVLNVSDGYTNSYLRDRESALRQRLESSEAIEELKRMSEDNIFRKATKLLQAGRSAHMACWY